MVTDNKMEKHVTLVAVLHIAFGLLGLLIAVAVFVVVTGGGAISGNTKAMAVASSVAFVIALFLAVLSVPGVIGGFGLLKYRPWARIVVLIVAALDLVNFPFGTIVGAYSIWVWV